MRPSEDALREGARWVLNLEHVPRGGTSGDHLGRGGGSSMEFHDRRPYAPGDDVRHIDWRALAKTDEVLVRVHREEVAPRLDLFVDTSLSMATTEAKAQAAVDLATVLVQSAQSGGYDVRVVTLGDRALRISMDELLREGLSFRSGRPLSDLIPDAGAEVRPSSVRLVLSDFLVPADPAHLVRPLGQGAGRVAMLQVLSPEDADPSASGALRLVDAELGEIREVVVDSAALSRYRDRLARLQSGLAEATQRHGGLFLTLPPGAPVAQSLTSLAAMGVVG